MDEEEHQVRLERARLILQEWFPDHLIIVRLRPRGLAWRSSDSAWAMGAVKKYLATADENERIEARREYDKPQENGC